MKRLETVAVALDTADWPTFSRWCSFFGPRVGVLKVGLEAYLRWGAEAVKEAKKWGDVFLDLKLHDIPNTVRGAVKAVRDEGASYLTIHASGGAAMIEAAAREAGETKILAVSVLTHLGEDDFTDLGIEGTAREVVARWARVAADNGAHGLVCSPLELSTLRPLLPAPFELVCPGIRMVQDALGDQKRVATPQDAVREGADLMVIGRPLTQAPNPEEALERIAEAIAGVVD